MNIISRDILADEARAKIEKGGMVLKPVSFVKNGMGSNYVNMSQADRFNAINKLTEIDSNLSSTIKMSGNYTTGFDIPMSWEGQEGEMSVNDKIKAGYFMSSNTLPSDWQNLWDALRIDVSTRKAALPTIRERIYNVIPNPNFTRTINISELTPIGIVFKENNGHGEAVNQGETTGGSYESINIVIYAAGFTWDLVAKLFDRTITSEMLMDAIMVGYNTLKDDLAISPILNYSYSGDQQTSPSTIGTGRQELLYNTLVNARGDLGKRLHPITKRRLGAKEVIILTNSFDGENIVDVASGLPSTNEKKYPAIRQIKEVIYYDDEFIDLRDRTEEYSGVADGKAYMLIAKSSIPNDYMAIAVKNDLMIEVDEQPDVKTLAQRQEAYWFAESIWYKGIEYFVQEITLPAWSE